jgi:hypothetical protein
MHTQTTETFQHVTGEKLATPSRSPETNDEASGGWNPWQYNVRLTKPTSDSE